MGKPTGFIEFARHGTPCRNPAERLLDYREIHTDLPDKMLIEQSSRCMDCGVPFCQSEHGCPIYNLIPEWNDLVYRGQWREALESLHKTNNFPEFTGRVCPAPCEGACTLGITDPPVAIKTIEQAIIDRGFAEGWVRPEPPTTRSGRKVIVVGSGPAGLAAAAQLNRAGHLVTVHERADRPGGLLMYGIPNMKLDKGVVDRRIDLLHREGIRFVTGKPIGDGRDGSLDIRELKSTADALLLATGATIPRDLPIPGRPLQGIHFAMDFLAANTHRLLDPESETQDFISAEGKDVIVIGGGDTGTDCVATALRHSCKSLVNFEILPEPPANRSTDNPWPTWPRIFRVDYGHEEAIHRFDRDPRTYLISATAFEGDARGRLTAIITERARWHDGRPRPVPDSRQRWPANLVLLAMGFRGPSGDVSTPLGIDLDERSNYRAAYGDYRTNVPGVFAAGDCRRGQSLVVRAIHEGREAARQVDLFLMGRTTLP